MGKLVTFNSPTKQHGHRQAMTKTFLRIKTRPEEYTPEVNKCQYSEVSHCQLCGAALTYSFNLIHAEDHDFNKNLSLKVGADCIYNFCQIYMPSSAEQILHTIEQSLSTSKISKFKTDNPEIFNQVQTIKSQIKTLSQNYGYTFTALEKFKNFTKWSRELSRNLYLSKPKVIKIEELFNQINSKEFLKLLLDHKNKPTISIKEHLNQNPSDKDFYTTYKELFQIIYFYPMSESSNILSDLEQQIFKQTINERLSKINPAAWLIQINNYPELTQYLLTQDFPKYSPEAQAQNHFKKFIPLNPQTINNLIASDNFNKIKKKLPKLPFIWHNIIMKFNLGNDYEV